jgi:MinD-like ATPase involved in chromosome partitioning or flagellar assembly/pimeloyl-ACP methyl ester carboxylesterase
VIYTFYSFKGGVGRSMALANVAELLCAKKLNVLMVDFDLEAPGLERYFSDALSTGLTPVDVQEHVGMIDLLTAYQKLRSLAAPKVVREGATMEERIAMLPTPPLSEYTVELRKRETGLGSLSLITAGARGRRHEFYAQQVLGFGWDRFYLEEEGELFFEWFRRETERSADVVLIDSRTGVTEMSGVCTHQLADVVVSFVAANQQNQDGTLRTAKNLANPDLIAKGRGGRTLSQILVPSRLEISEGDQAKRFQENLPRLVAETFPNGIPGQGSVSFELAIPYVPYFAFDERVAVREPNHPFAKLIQEPVAKLASVMAAFAPADKAMYLRHHSSTEHLAKLAENLVQAWTPEPLVQVRALLERLVTVSVGSHGSTFSVRAVPLDELPKPLTSLIDRFVAIGTISLDRGANGEVLASFADPQLPFQWARLNKWILGDMFFLAWLQRVGTGAAEWAATNRSQDLLSGTPLEEARRWMKEKSLFMNEKERAYVEASQAFDLTTRAAAEQQQESTRPAKLMGSDPQRPLLTPIRNQSNPVAILFIHGFHGNPTTTWGEFPALLAADPRLGDWDIFTVGYATSLQLDLVGIWRADAPISRLSLMFSTACAAEPLRRYKSLSIIAHSMGGLILQRALLDDPTLAGRTSHVFLFGTPSAGLAKAGPFSFLKRQARDLGDRSEFIREVRQGWSTKFGEHPPFRFCTVAGDQDEFVPPNSSLDPFPMPQRAVVPGNHLEMVKPATASNLSVQLVLEAMAGGSSLGGLRSAAKLALESREFARTIELLWPLRNELDEKGLVDLSLALEQSGRIDDAIAVLKGRHPDDLDALGVLAGRWKRRWLAERRRADAEEALRLYSQGLQQAESRGRYDQAYYHGINLAFMQLAYLSDLGAARQTAERVLAHCAKGQPGLWSAATEGEASLILGQTDRALSCYQKAIDYSPEPRQVDSMYQQAARIADLIGDEEALRSLPVLFQRESLSYPAEGSRAMA